jgi:serine/threonine protein kinase
MAVEVKCPNCETLLDLPILVAGEIGSPSKKCPACKMRFLFDFTGIDSSGTSDPMDYMSRIDLPEYQLLGILGSGGMSYVYSAVHLETNRLCALKVMPPRLARRRKLVDRFRREAHLMRSLRHENIVMIIDGKFEGPNPYVSMPFLPGRTLKQRLRDSRRPSLEEIVAIISPLSSAIDYLHRCSIIHRDLKPSNVYLTLSGEVKLIDLGVARDMEHASDLTEDGVNIGTPAFNAPEVFEYGEAGPMSDQYSLAVIIYQMISGHYPMGLFHWPRQYLSDLPEQSEIAILKGLSHNPDDRYESVHEFAREFIRPMVRYMPAPGTFHEIIKDSALFNPRLLMKPANYDDLLIARSSQTQSRYQWFTEKMNKILFG